MSLWLAIEFDNETKELIHNKQIELKIQYPEAKYELFDKFHITVNFLTDNNLLIQDANKLLNYIKNNYDLKQFEVELSGYRKFDQNCCWIGMNNSFELYKIKYLIDEVINKLNLNFKDKFKEYIPHITIAYDFKNDIDVDFNVIPIKIKTLSLWQSYKCNDTYMQNVINRVNLC